MAKVPEDAAGSRRKWLPIAALLLLSFLWAADWLRADLFPGSEVGLKLSPLWSTAAQLGLFAGLSACGALLRKQSWTAGRFAGPAVLVGLGLFVLPTVLTGLSRNWVADSTRVALFSVTPLFAIVFEPHFGAGGEKSDGWRAMPAAMLGIAGTLLVFPVEAPHSYAATFAFAGLLGAAIAAAAGNCLGVKIAKQCGSLAILSTISCGSAAFLLALKGLIFPQKGAADIALGFWAISGLLGLALLFWLMRHMSAVQMTTRFLIAPLLANLIGLAFLRPHLQVQAWIGLSLIAAGSAWLLLAPAEAAEPTLNTLQVK